MFRTLIYPSSGACDYSVELPHWSYCSWFDMCWSFGVVELEWYPCCRLQPAKRIPLQPNHTSNQEQYDQCGISTEQSQAPDDGYILTPNDDYSGRTAPLTSKFCISYIYATNTGTEHIKHDIYSPFFPLQNAVCFIILTYLVPVVFTVCIQNVLK